MVSPNDDMIICMGMSEQVYPSFFLQRARYHVRATSIFAFHSIQLICCPSFSPQLASSPPPSSSPLLLLHPSSPPRLLDFATLLLSPSLFSSGEGWRHGAHNNNNLVFSRWSSMGALSSVGPRRTSSTSIDSTREKVSARDAECRDA